MWVETIVSVLQSPGRREAKQKGRVCAYVKNRGTEFRTKKSVWMTARVRESHWGCVFVDAFQQGHNLRSRFVWAAMQRSWGRSRRWSDATSLMTTEGATHPCYVWKQVFILTNLTPRTTWVTDAFVCDSSALETEVGKDDVKTPRRHRFIKPMNMFAIITPRLVLQSLSQTMAAVFRAE